MPQVIAGEFQPINKNMAIIMKKPFICIIACVDQESNSVTTNAVLFNTFEEALNYAREDADFYIHLANNYTERIGTRKLHASIQMSGRYINKTYTIRDLSYVKEDTKLCNFLNTYASWDYDHEGYTI